MKKTIMLALVASAAMMSSNVFASSKIEAGKEAVKKFNCASCHGDQFNNGIDPSYPKLAGQNKDYLEHALKAYKRGAVGLAGRSNAIMEAQVKELSNKDIENIAAYLHSLPPSLVMKK
jgi:cytochrome c553